MLSSPRNISNLIQHLRYSLVKQSFILLISTNKLDRFPGRASKHRNGHAIIAAFCHLQKHGAVINQR